MCSLNIRKAFLRLNMMDEIHKWGGEDIRIRPGITHKETQARQKIIDRYYHFVHYNAVGIAPHKPNGGKAGVFDFLGQLGIGFRVGTTQSEAFPYIKGKYGGSLQPPHNMLIIMEEAHGLNRSFVSDASNAESGAGVKVKSYLYSLLMQATDCKFIALSGTPMISNPYETAPMYNILRGPVKETGTAFPLSELVFNSLFVDSTNYKILNQELFMRRIIGLSSYFKGITDDKEGLIYPARRDIVDVVTMSKYQSAVHADYASQEDMELPPKPKKLSKLPTESSLGY